MKAIKVLIQIDNILALWPYEYPNLLESGLLTQPSTLGTLINQILHFFDELCINKVLSMSYIHCLIGVGMDNDKFMSSTMAMLEDVPARIYKHSLQVPHITSLGWLFGMHEDFLLQPFKLLLPNTVKKLALNQSPVIQFGLTYKPIYDGMSWQEWKKSLASQMGCPRGGYHGDSPDI